MKSFLLFVLVGLFWTSALAQTTCKVTDIIGCFEDYVDQKRALPYVARDGTTGDMSQEICAGLCYRYNYSISAVEYSYQCFCGNDFVYKNPTPMSDCNSPCSANPQENCGGGNRMLAFHASCSGRPAPSFHGCIDATSKSLPFCNTGLSIQARVSDLLGRLSLDEKLGLLGPDYSHNHVDPCACLTAGVSRLGVSPYLQLVETNSAVSAACLSANKCATEFPGPTLLAASFNRTLWHKKGEITSDEMRAFNNLGGSRGDPNALIGLVGYGPNINIVRDPRFGRNSELPSEDPFLSGSYATEFVQGMQVGSDNKFFKMIAGLKHYACYSVEDGRNARMFNVSTFDLWDTYLMQYKMAFDAKQGNAQAVMCSYAGVNGAPSCASDYLLNKVLRTTWGRSDVVVVSDCGAIGNMVSGNHYASNNADAAAKALNGGCDVNLGDSFYPPVANGGNGALPSAISSGATNVAHVDASVTRVLEKRFSTGQFDPIDNQVYTTLGADHVNSSSSWEFTLETAGQGLILLKNSKETLPFASGKKLAVVGPHVFSKRDLLEDYIGTECASGGDACIRTIAEVFTNLHGAGNTQVAKGVDIDSSDTSGIQAALNAVNGADQVVLCLGIGNTQEHEGIDRKTTTLPGQQENFARQVIATGKPVVVVIISGGIISFDNLISSSPAIIQAFYPSMRTGEALYRAIFGQVNRWGKLPVTIYPANYINQVDMYSFDMTKSPGRTYRYYTGTPLFPFGFGLSLTNFTYSCSGKTAADRSTTISCSVSNIGSRTGDEILMVFHRAGDDVRSKAGHPVPRRSLADFERIALNNGEKKNVQFVISADKLALTNNQGDKVMYAGTHYLDVTDGVNAESTITVTISQQMERVIEYAPQNE